VGRFEPTTRLGKALTVHGAKIDKKWDAFVLRRSGAIGITLGVVVLLRRPQWPFVLMAALGIILSVFGIARDRLRSAKE
jgi:hypothetical protein